MRILCQGLIISSLQKCSFSKTVKCMYITVPVGIKKDMISQNKQQSGCVIDNRMDFKTAQVLPTVTFLCIPVLFFFSPAMIINDLSFLCTWISTEYLEISLSNLWYRTYTMYSYNSKSLFHYIMYAFCFFYKENGRIIYCFSHVSNH